MQLETNASIRLCLLHDGNQVQPGTPIASTTPRARVRRQLISAQDDIDIPEAPDPTGKIDVATARADTRALPPVLGTQFFLPAIPMTMMSVANTRASAPSTGPDVQILDVCSVEQCDVKSSSMISCQQCNNFIFCGKRCAKKCPCLQKSHENVSGVPVCDTGMLSVVNRVANSSSVTQTCNYCGSQEESVDNTFKV